MTLLSQIKATHMQLRKDRFTDLAACLSTFIADAERIGKDAGHETTDAEVVQLLKKYVKNAEEVQKYTATDAVKLEIDLYTKFLPTQLTGTGLQSMIAAMVQKTQATSAKDMGKVMAALKEQAGGQYDGAEASKLIKELLSV